MLFIYGALTIGGIETFFVRIAKERSKNGLYTAVLLLSHAQKSDETLLREMKKFAVVYFADDLFYGSILFKNHFPLLMPIRTNKLTDILNQVNQIHVSDGMNALLSYRLLQHVGKSLPITIGFYHYIQFLWGGDNVPYYEKLNRLFVFNYLPQQCLLFFSEGNRDLYRKHKNMSFNLANVFRLGVVSQKEVNISGQLSSSIKICSVGRLVEFKTYNFYMLDVIKNLTRKGFNVEFHIYGDGPLLEFISRKISSYKLTNNVYLKGTLDYLVFDEIVSTYDLFIGSGTAIIQAASLGVPSIVGVENVVQPKSYGYFSEVHQYEYNFNGLNLPFYGVEQLILDYVQMDLVQRLNLKKQHIESVGSFTNEFCQKSMDKLKNIHMPTQKFKFNRFAYEISRVVDRLKRKFNKKHPFNLRHVVIRK